MSPASLAASFGKDHAPGPKYLYNHVSLKGKLVLPNQKAVSLEFYLDATERYIEKTTLA